MPLFLSSQSAVPESFVAAAAEDRCATDARKFSRRMWDAKPGEVEETYLNLNPGTYCLSVWGVDAFSRPSPKPAQLWVKISS